LYNEKRQQIISSTRKFSPLHNPESTFRAHRVIEWLTMQRIKLVVFDIGGTIIEDHGEVLAAYETALQVNGVTVSAAELAESKGASKRDVIRRFVERRWGKGDSANQERIEKTYDDFRKELEKAFSNGGVNPISGAARAFDWLRSHGILCATTTGFYRSIVDRILASAGWRATFAACICGEDVMQGRPAPYMIFRAMEAAGIDDVRHVLNVGDTPLDIQAGKRAGVLGAIGVLSGIHKEARLLQESPSFLIPSAADVPALIEAHYS
jgi:phosphonatase-like hydrolase